MTVRVTAWSDGERGQKRWMVDVRARRADGSKVRDRKIIEGPRSAGQAWGDRRQAVLLGELRAPVAPVGPGKVLTIAEWAPTFVARHYQGKKQSSVDTARSILDTHVLPFVGALPLDALKQHVVDGLEEKWRAGGYSETKRERTIRPCKSKKTINDRKVVLISCLKYALACSEETGLRAMPCKIKLAKIDSQRAPAFYSPERYAQIVAAAESLNDPRALAIVLLGGDVGLRVGEMMAARRDCVNYRTGKITPAASVYQRSRAERFEGEPKGGEAIGILMPARLARALKALPVKGEYLLHDDGKPLTMKAAKWIVKRVEKAAGVPVTGAIHIYRHTYGSHLAMAGVPVREIMRIMRHKNLATTLRYMHLTRHGQEHAVSALESLRAG